MFIRIYKTRCLKRFVVLQYNNPAADRPPVPNTVVSTPLIYPRDYIVGYETYALAHTHTHTPDE